MLYYRVRVLSKRWTKWLYDVGNKPTTKFYSKKYPVILPKTEFPLHISTKTRMERDLWIAEKTLFSELYQWQRNHNHGEEFILHDGPPYANGRPHMGHALNKILKDITLRYNLLQGRKVHYVPGWDCHGLPIEMKAFGPKGNMTQIQPLELREKARNFALDAIKEQRAAFERWGILANWDENCYFTFRPEYVAKQINIFFKLHEMGLVYRDYKPVYWSPSSKTALAESELEYNPNHESSSVYLKLLLTTPLPTHLKVPLGAKVYVIIWTTTPWTLPANQAVCFNSNNTYSVVSVNFQGEKQCWVIASELRTVLEQTVKVSSQLLGEIPGSALNGFNYLHPFDKQKALHLLPADHVTVSKGTGFVHTAPAHGPEDFLVAIQNHIPIACLVDENGDYNDQTGEELAGLHVLTTGQEKVLRLLRSDIVHHSPFIHSYPYDWRTKLPVILRASLQWFINTDIIKHKALEAMKDVAVIPAAQEKPMLNQLATRPYWCISRQRLWGVPIPVFYAKNSTPQKAIINKDIINRLSSLFLDRGTDVWWKLSAQELIGEKLMTELDITPGQIDKGEDILDIWFDSGVSWNCVLPEGKQANLYLEGIDQFGGWFQSSLLTSVSLTGKAPYKKLFVHGFVLDSEGRKMSKSLGNVIDPEQITDGNQKQQPAYGVDVLRWWTASHVTGNGSNVPVSNSLIQQAAEDVQKIRAIYRFLLGNINGISQELIDSIQMKDLSLLDQYMLFLTSEFVSNVTSAYEEMNYKKVTSLATQFINSQVSAFYCHLVKDRLYCHRENSSTRNGAVYVLNEIFNSVSLVLAPLLPHLSEEVYLYHPIHAGQGGLFRKCRLSQSQDRFREQDVSQLMKAALIVKDAVNQLIGSGNRKEWNAELCVNLVDYQALQKLQTEERTCDSTLCELFQVAYVTLRSDPQLNASIEQGIDIKTNHSDMKRVIVSCAGPMALTLTKTNCKLCPRCRRFTSDDGDLCCNCVSVLKR